MKRLRTWLFILLPLLALVALWLLLRGGAFNGPLLRLAIKQANAALRGEVSATALHGDPLGTLRLEHVLVRVDADTLLAAESITLAWQPARLLHHEVCVDSLVLAAPRLCLRQDDSGAWNFFRLLPPKREHKPRKPSKLGVNVGLFALRGADVRLDTLRLPLELEAGGRYGVDSLHATLKLQTGGQYLRLTADGGSLSRSPQYRLAAVFRHLNAATWPGLPESDLNGGLRAQAGGLGAPDMAVTWQLTGERCVAAGYSASALRSAGELRGRTVRGSLGAEGEWGGLNVQVDSLDLDSKAWALTVQGRNLTPGVLLHRPELTLTANLQGAAHGTALNSALVNLRVNELRDPARPQLNGASATLAATLRDSLLRGTLAVEGGFGGVNADIAALDLRRQSYDLTLFTHALNLARLPIHSDVSTSIDARLDVQGRGFLPQTADASFCLRTRDAQLQGYTLDTLAVSGNLHRRNVVLDTLLATGNGLRLSGFGEATPDSIVFAAVALDIDSLSTVGALLRRPGLSGSLHADGRLWGGYLSSWSVLTWQALGLRFNNLSADSLGGTVIMSWKKWEGNFNAVVIVQCDSLLAGATPITGILATAAYDGRTTDVTLDAALPDSLLAHVRALYTPPGEVLLPTLRLRYMGTEWVADSTRVTLDKGSVRLHGLRLASPQGELTAEGSYSAPGYCNATVAMHASPLNLPMLNLYADGISARASVEGNLPAPDMALLAEARELRVKGWPVHALTLMLARQADSLSVTCRVAPDSTGSLDIEAGLPLNPPDRMKQDGPLARSRPFSARVNSDGLNLDYLNGHGLPVQEIDGVLTADLNLRGTLADPVGEGRLRLHGGNVLLPAYQTRLHDIDFLLRAEERRLVLDSLTVSTTRGSMRAGGTATWRLSPTPGFSDYLLTLRADNLLIADSRALRLRADADLRLTESAGKPLVQGKVAFMQARVNVDALRGGSEAHTGLPMLVQALPDSLRTPEDTVPAPKPALPANADVTFVIPRNTWVNGRDFQLELRGQLRLRLQDGQPGLEGDLTIARGNYTLYGKRLVIQEGEITFTGQSSLQPVLNIVAAYKFRSDDHTRHTLVITITGGLGEPNITFVLDDVAIEQTDAVSYLLFNRGSGELSQGEQSLLSEQYGSGGLAFGMLASRLQSSVSSTLRDRLLLDVVELGGDTGWNQGSVVLGKYLTTDLYLSYEHEFNIGRKDQLEADRLSLEYQINRWLFLQAVQGSESDTGLDLIYKWEK